MSYVAGGAYAAGFATSQFSTGAAMNADALPVATATRNGTDDAGFVLIVANLATGRYKVTGTVPAGYAVGDAVQVSVTAMVDGVAGCGVVDSFVAGEAERGTDNAALASVATETRLARLNATVSSRAIPGDAMNVSQLAGSTQRATDLAEIAQYLIANAAVLNDVVADDSLLAKLMATDGDISGWNDSTDALQSLRDAMLSPAALLARLIGPALRSASTSFWMVEGDTKPNITVTVTDDEGSAVNITGATITVRFYKTGDTQLLLAKTTADDVTITNGAAGILQWTWDATDWTLLTEVGEDAYEIEVEVTSFLAGGKQSVRTFLSMSVREKRNTT